MTFSYRGFMTNRFCTALALSILSLVSRAEAQELAPYEIVPDGRQYEIQMGPSERSLKNLSVYFVSTGNVSNNVTVDIMGPQGIVGTARGGALGGEVAASALASPAVVSDLLVRAYPEKKEAPSFSTLTYGSDMREGYVSANFHLQKDACGPKTSRYVSQVKLDLTGIAPELYDQVFSIVLSVRENPFKGDKVASVKPSSDGKYRGEPILLMQTIGYGGEYVNKVTWKNGRIVARKRIPIVKYVGYMGYGLSLARIKTLIGGGKHTYELSNGSDIYGVCLKATRTRQRVNGYPNSRPGT